MVFYAGVDLGKRKSHVRVITAERKVVEDLKIENSPDAFRKMFAKYRGEVEVACEASSNAFWVADTLETVVRKVHVGDARKIRWIAEARIKTDKLDAGILAELLRADLFPDIHVPPKRIRELRELVRGLVRMRRNAARTRNQIHGLLSRQGIPYDSEEVRGSKLKEFIGQCDLSQPVRTAADALGRLEQAAHKEAETLEKMALKALAEEPGLRSQVDLLESIPGVGVFSALLLVVELWDITRFRDPEHLASYIGFIPSTHQSGDTMYHGRMTKQGNALLRWILVQDAWQSIRRGFYFQKLYARQKPRLGKARAIVPVARALLGTIYRVWSAKKKYEDLFKESLVG